jgi:hypothetical protein
MHFSAALQHLKAACKLQLLLVRAYQALDDAHMWAGGEQIARKGMEGRVINTCRMLTCQLTDHCCAQCMGRLLGVKPWRDCHAHMRRMAAASSSLSLLPFVTVFMGWQAGQPLMHYCKAVLVNLPLRATASRRPLFAVPNNSLRPAVC